MSIMSDVEIAERSTTRTPMIKPFVANGIKTRTERLALNGLPHFDKEVPIISYGLSSYGYDARLAREIKVFTNVYGGIVDPKRFDTGTLVEVTPNPDGSVIVPPNSFLLGRTEEWFHVPRDVLVVCLGKSTYARCGIIVNVTPLEPEWEGHVTLEISNTTPLPAKVYAEEGICQFLFLKADRVCKTSYADKKGKYQSQVGVTTAKV